jgi:hypothetical protein
MLKTYRFTIPSRYSEDSPGYKHAEARQGHYILSDSEANARNGLVDRLKRSGWSDISADDFELHRKTAIGVLADDEVCFSS